MVSFSLVQSSEKTKETEERLQQIRHQIQSVQSTLKNNKKKYSSAEKQLQKTEKKINTAAKILRGTQRQIREKNKELKSLKNEEKTLNQIRKRHQALLASQIKSAYTSGHQEYLKMLLNQEEPEKLGRVVTYFDYLNKARAESIKVLGETISQLIDVKNEITESLKELTLLESAQKQEQKQLLSLKKTREEEVRKLAGSIASQDKKLSSLKLNKQELETLLQEMQEALKEMFQQQNLVGLKPMKGKLSWPIRGSLTLKYGDTVNTGINSSGIRISAKEGIDVSSVHHGRVIFSDWLRGFGLLTIIDHGHGYMSLYGNNQSLFKDVGDWVEAGEMIATVGQSGGQTAPGLYFEIRHQGKAENPLRWIKRK